MILKYSFLLAMPVTMISIAMQLSASYVDQYAHEVLYVQRLY